MKLTLHQKITILLILPKYKHFLPIWDCWSALVYIQYKSAQLLDKGYGRNCGVTLGNILDAHFLMHFVPPHYLNIVSILNFAHHHFWLKLLQELGYLL
jgi:hypothetical protein